MRNHHRRRFVEEFTLLIFVFCCTQLPYRHDKRLGLFAWWLLRISHRYVRKLIYSALKSRPTYFRRCTSVALSALNESSHVTLNLDTICHAPAMQGTVIQIISTSTTVGSRVLATRCEVSDCEQRIVGRIDPFRSRPTDVFCRYSKRGKGSSSSRATTSRCRLRLPTPNCDL